MLVPGAPDDPIALIDSRDLARFTLSRAAGTFECGGPAGRNTLADLVDALRLAGDPEPTWVDARWLATQDVEPWTEIPLWAGADDLGVWTHDNDAAEAAGLVWRPLADTVRDTWTWQQAVDGGWTPSARTPGLAAAKEAELLTAWRAR